MQTLMNRLDRLGGIEQENSLARWLERIAFIFLVLMILSAPHSIAATQTAWLLGMATTIIRLIIKPRPKLPRTSLDKALWAFFGWTVVTSVLSYAPDISIDKLRGALLFLIFYFVLYNLRNIRAAKFLAFALVFSCMASVVWAPIERIYGRGVEVSGIAPNSIFAKGVYFNHDIYLANKGRNLQTFDNAQATENERLAPLKEDEALVEVEGRKIRTPEELVAEIEKNDVSYLECFNPPNYFTTKVRRADLLSGTTAIEKLGISSWKHNRTWRFAGFYGQIITYAEVLQMIASLALGLFLALDKKRSRAGAILALCVVLMIFALLMTFTRSTQAAFLASSIAMILLCAANRKLILTLSIFALPLIISGFFFVQQNRNVDAGKRDESVEYRQTVYREGFSLWTSSARNFLIGIGMDSTKRFAKEWHLFDDGRLPTSHFHSTPLQLLVERGLPALLLWIWVLWLYGRTLLGKLRITNYELRNNEIRDDLTTHPKSKIQNLKSLDWQTRGIILGCFGSLIGFVGSSLVNYSLGDSEVAMVFFMLMGIGVYLCVIQSNSPTETNH